VPIGDKGDAGLLATSYLHAFLISALEAHPVILLKRLLSARHSMRKGHPHHRKVAPKKLERKPLFASFEGMSPSPHRVLISSLSKSIKPM